MRTTRPCHDPTTSRMFQIGTHACSPMMNLVCKKKMIITTIFKIECVSNVWPLVYIKIFTVKHDYIKDALICILRFVFLLMKIIDYNTNTVDFHFVVTFYSSILDIFHNLLSVIKVFKIILCPQ